MAARASATPSAPPSATVRADPLEKETLLPPLMGLQVRGTSVEGGTLVVQSRLSLNMASLVRAERPEDNSFTAPIA